MARSAEGLPTKPKRKPPPKRPPPKKPRTPNNRGAKGNNEFYKFVQKPGRPLDYSPDKLWDKAVEYFEWCESNPITKDAGGGKTQNLGRPYTLSGFCLYAGITLQTFLNYAEGIGYTEFFDICGHIREIIKNHKYEGAAVGKFNAAIIARDLGLVDKQERDIGNAGGKPFQTESKVLTAEITPDMDEKTASQIYRTWLNPPKEQA